jgi:hypothetical protein
MTTNSTTPAQHSSTAVLLVSTRDERVTIARGSYLLAYRWAQHNAGAGPAVRIDSVDDFRRRLTEGEAIADPTGSTFRIVGKSVRITPTAGR